MNISAKIFFALFLLAITQSFLVKKKETVYTTFTVRYPQSKLKGDMYIRGDNCNLTWSKGVKVNHTGNNQWSTALLCTKGVNISVKVLQNDSVWMFGGNKVFTGGQQQVWIYPSFNPSANKIIDKSNITSKILNNTRKVSLYYPPSYFDNTIKKYEVLIMHDGQNLFNNSQSAFGTAWMVQNTINTQTAQGNMREIIVVGVWNTNDRNNQYTYSVDPQYKFGGKGDKYLDFLEQQLIPIIRNDWHQDRVYGFGIGGSSLGGLISCYAGYTRPSPWLKSICMSSSFWWNSQDFNNKILSPQKYDHNSQFYLDSGDSGTNQDSKNQTTRVYNHMTEIGYIANKKIFHYIDKGGQHNEYYWGRRFAIPMMKLYPNDD